MRHTLFLLLPLLLSCASRQTLLKGTVYPTRDSGDHYVLLKAYHFPKAGITRILPLDGGGGIVVGFVTGDLALIDRKTHVIHVFPRLAAGGIIDLVPLPGGRLVAAATDGTLALWDHEKRIAVKTVRLAGGYPAALCLQGGRLVVGTRDGKLRSFSFTLEEGPLLYQGSVPLWAVVSTPSSGGCVAADGAGRLLSFRSLAKGEIPVIVQAHKEAIEALAISPDGKLLASGGRDRLVKVRVLGAGADPAVVILRGHSDSVLTLAFCPDSGLLASSGWDCAVFLFNKNFTILDVVRAHGSTLQSLCFLPGTAGKNLLCTSGLDGFVKIWEIYTGQK